jgi:hypothetical protein
MKYTTLDTTGIPTAFYSDDINDSIPTEAIVITDEQWLECINNSGQRCFKDGALVPYTITLTASEIAKAAHNTLVGEALKALDITDKVSYRCFKAGIVYPADWQTYTLALRSIVNESDMSSTTLPIPPSYPLGT